MDIPGPAPTDLMGRVRIGDITLTHADLDYLTDLTNPVLEPVYLPEICPDCMRIPTEVGRHVLIEPNRRVAIGCEGAWPPLVVDDHWVCVRRGHCDGDH